MLRRHKAVVVAAVNLWNPENLWMFTSNRYAPSLVGLTTGDGFGIGDTFLFEHAVG